MIREEVMREGMRMKAVAFEEKIRAEGGSVIARMCWKEILERERERGSRWEEDRKRFYEGRGYAGIEVERRRQEGESMKEELMKRGMQIEGQERWGKIRQPKYNGTNFYGVKGLQDT